MGMEVVTAVVEGVMEVMEVTEVEEVVVVAVEAVAEEGVEVEVAVVGADQFLRLLLCYWRVEVMTTMK